MNHPLRYALLTACALGPWAHAQEAAEDGADFILSEFQVARSGVALALQDADGDGDLDLFQLDQNGVSVRLLGADRRFEPLPSARMPWPTGRVAWDMADLDGDGRAELVALLGEQDVRAFQLSESGSFGEGRVVLQEQAWLPPGAARVDFARDVNADGHADLVLPGIREHRVFLSDGQGGWTAPIQVAYEADVSLEVGNPERLNGRFGRSVSIPWFTIQDVDGDGQVDLISETTERVAFHLADGGLASKPTWVLDLDALRAELPRTKGVNLDDLLDNAPPLVEWEVADLDGQAPMELIVAVGSRFRIYTGGARTGPRETPDQLLKASGKVLGFYVRDVLGDARPELQLVRGQRISLGRALRYLILPGQLNFDVFTYANETGLFGRRPAQRGTVGLAIPRLLTFVDDAKELAETIDEQFEVPARRIAFGVDGASDDVVDIRDGRLVVVENCAPGPQALEGLIDGEPEFDKILEALVLKELDRRGDEGELVFELAELDTYQFAPGSALRQASQRGEVTAQAPFTKVKDPVLRTLDLDGDGRADVVGWGKVEGGWAARLYVRR